jgi:hypothetical protein
MYVDYCAVCTFLGGGRTSTYFPVERLVVDVLSVQCVASTCAVLAWDRVVSNDYSTYSIYFKTWYAARTMVQSHYVRLHSCKRSSRSIAFLYFISPMY